MTRFRGGKAPDWSAAGSTWTVDREDREDRRSMRSMNPHQEGGGQNRRVFQQCRKSRREPKRMDVSLEGVDIIR